MNARPPKPPKPTDRPSSPRHKTRAKSSRRPKTPSLGVLKSQPTTEESMSAWKEIRETPSPRAAAIIAVAYLESVLRFVIASRFVFLTNDELNTTLHKMGGPLNSFSQATELGFALGLYGQMIHCDLNIIRVIRNAFAHTMKPLSFDTPDIAKEIANLQYLKTKKGKLNPPIDGADEITMGELMERGMLFTTNREKYIETCMMIAADLATQVNFKLRPRKPALP
jgi:hypothetical protein